MTIEPPSQDSTGPRGPRGAEGAQGHGFDQPQPFSEGPIEAPGGCSRPLLLGCAVTVVLLGLLLLGVLWKGRELMPALFRWSLDQFEQQVTDSLPADLSETERRRLADAFDGAAAAVEDGSADPAALQRLQGHLLGVARAGELTRDRVLELIEALEAVAGERAPPPAPEPLRDPDEGAMPLAFRGLPSSQRLAAT
jgi:hypothetical protein